MEDKMKPKTYTLLTLVVAIIFVGVLISPDIRPMSLEQHRHNFIEHKNHIIGDLLPQGKYRCCLEKPCTYCIEKTPGHGKGATCDCLKDVINGVHPCGECIGEILEGHGNQYLADKFATAIAEKTGEKEAIQRIIEDKYGVPAEDQL
jgi:hypothetical protein